MFKRLEENQVQAPSVISVWWFLEGPSRVRAAFQHLPSAVRVGKGPWYLIRTCCHWFLFYPSLVAVPNPLAVLTVTKFVSHKDTHTREQFWSRWGRQFLHAQNRIRDLLSCSCSPCTVGQVYAEQIVCPGPTAWHSHVLHQRGLHSCSMEIKEKNPVAFSGSGYDHLN